MDLIYTRQCLWNCIGTSAFANVSYLVAYVEEHQLLPMLVI